MMRISLIFFLFLFLHSPVSAQKIQNFREHEIIDAGNGLKIEILKCRGEGEGAECDVIFYTEKRQLGKRQWEKLSKINELEQAAKKEKEPVAVTVKKPLKPNAKKKNKKVEIIHEQPEKVKEDSVKNITPEPVPEIVEKKIPVYIKPANTYSLQQCFLLALDKNIGLKKAQNNIKANIIDHKTAQYNLLPSVSYNLGHYFSFGKNIDPVTNTFVNQNFSGGFTAVGLQLQLFSGFSRLNLIKQSAYLVESAEYAKKRAELELLTNVTLTYARLLLNKELIRVQKNEMLGTVRQLEVINEKIKVGRLTRYEAYAFNARLNTEQANLVTIQNDSSAASQDLKHLLNISYKQQFEIAPVDSFMLSNIYNARITTTDFIDTILQNHPAIKQAKLEEQSAQMGLKIAKGNLYPSLSVGGNIATNYNVDQINANGQKIPLNTQLNDNIGKNVNVSLHVPIFSQMENANRIKKERINISNAQLNIQEAETGIVTNTLQLINDFNASRQKYTATLSAMEQSNLSFTMYEEKYKLGQISSLELLTSRELLNTATSQYLQAKLELYFRYQLLLLLKK